MSIKIFVSYSHKDKQYLADDSLLGFLKGLENEGAEFWWDEKIIAGEKWDDKIRAKLDDTHIALLLVSQWFLDSPYCNNVEINGFLRKAGEGRLTIVPIILSACDWKSHAWLKSVQAFPGNKETLEEHYTDPGKQKRLFVNIRDTLRQHMFMLSRPISNPPKTSNAGNLTDDLIGFGKAKLPEGTDDRSLADIFKMPGITENVIPAKSQSWSDFLVNKPVSADSIPGLTGYFAMKLDWDLDAIDSGNGLLTRDKLKKAIMMLNAERDKLIFERSNTVYVTGRIKDAKEYLAEMEKRNLDALDYMPEQLKNLPDNLKLPACDILLNFRPWSNQINQEKIDDAKYRVNAGRHNSQNQKDSQLALIKEVAKHLGLIG